MSKKKRAEPLGEYVNVNLDIRCQKETLVYIDVRLLHALACFSHVYLSFINLINKACESKLESKYDKNTPKTEMRVCA